VDNLCAVSIPQPWTWCIAHDTTKTAGGNWCPTYRGPLLIHASRDMTLAEHRAASDWIQSATGILIPGPRDTERGGLALGALLARAELVDVRFNERGHQIVSEGGRQLFCARCERTVGDLGDRCPRPDPWGKGCKFAFIFRNIIAFHEPIRWRGGKAIWRVDPADAPPARRQALFDALARTDDELRGAAA
jgi:hypothetical protein